jgi:5-methylcytosine-specific restriction protein A
MPNRIPLACSVCGKRACEVHRKRRDERESASRRGYGAAHRKWRALILSLHPLCVHCLARGHLTPATVADHIKPLTKGGGWEIENGQGLCAACHNRKTVAERWGKHG